MTLTLPFEAAVAWGTGAVSLAVLLWWWLEDGRALPTITGPARPRFWRCQICTAVYTAAPAERLTICPTCGTYNSEEGSHTA